MSCRSQGGCYNPTQRCDGIRDCFDNSDEDNCDSSLCGPHRDGYLCRNRRCISSLMRCDGIQDCGDYSDEESCMKVNIFVTWSEVVRVLILCFILIHDRADVLYELLSERNSWWNDTTFYFTDVSDHCCHFGFSNLRLTAYNRSRLRFASISSAHCSWEALVHNPDAAACSQVGFSSFQNVLSVYMTCWIW